MVTFVQYHLGRKEVWISWKTGLASQIQVSRPPQNIPIFKHWPNKTVTCTSVRSKDTWTLTLRNVQTEDRGPYMCQVNSTPVRKQVIKISPGQSSLYAASLACGCSSHV